MTAYARAASPGTIIRTLSVVRALTTTGGAVGFRFSIVTLYPRPLAPMRFLLSGERQAHRDERFPRPGCRVDAMRIRDLQALDTDYGDIGLPVKTNVRATQRFNHERRMRQMDDATVLCVSGLQLHRLHSLLPSGRQVAHLLSTTKLASSGSSVGCPRQTSDTAVRSWSRALSACYLGLRSSVSRFFAVHSVPGFLRRWTASNAPELILWRIAETVPREDRDLAGFSCLPSVSRACGFLTHPRF